jgi:pimeloyl-ACP methyl ester carboxylesterase
MAFRLMTVAASALLLAASAVDLPYLKAQQRIALPDGRRINVYCTGQGNPTVMLEGGWTTETSYWRKVQPALARRSRVCSYDRAGYGFSDPGPLPRTAVAIAQDFAAMVDALRLHGPIILMAHSLGAFPARLYASAHPDRVAALVLLDPPSEDDRALSSALGPRFEPTGFVASVATCSAAVIAHPDITPDPPICLSSPTPTMPDGFNRMRSAMQRTAAYQRTAASELGAMYGVDGYEMRASPLWLRAMPLIVLTAENGSTDPSYSESENTEVRQIQWAAQARIAALSRRSVHRLLVGASHFIPMERPDDAVAAVDAARAMLGANAR